MITAAGSPRIRASLLFFTPSSSTSSRARSGSRVFASTQEKAVPTILRILAKMEVFFTRALSGICVPSNIGRPASIDIVPAFTIPMTSRSYWRTSPARQGRGPGRSAGRAQGSAAARSEASESPATTAIKG